MFSSRASTRLALLLALAAVAHRLWLAGNQYVLPIDTGTLGLMALNILDGDRPLFLYGFCYSGAPLAYVVALFFRIGGVSLFTMVLPIALLAGLWVWLSFLLFRRLAGSAAGLAAALLFAFPDRYTSWYTHTPDTSYGAFLPLAALILWLAVEIEARDARGWRLCLWLALLGAAGGLAFWTNAMIAPYLLVAVVPLGIHLRRHRFPPALLAACLPAALLFLLAVSPLLRMAGHIARGPTLAWKLDPAWLAANYRLLVAETMPLFFPWTTAPGVGIRLAGWLFVAAGLAVGLWTWARPWRHAPRWRAALPPLLIVCFLAGYLPHEMAGEAVPRYLLPLWTMFLGCAVARPMGSASPGLRAAAKLLLAVWVAWNLYGARALARLGREDRDACLARRAAVAAAVERLGARHATLLGDYYFQAEANGMTFLTRRRVRYAAAGKERHFPTAQAVEREPRRIYVCQQSLLPAARNSLRALDAQWRETPLDGVTLLHDMRPGARSRRAQPARAQRQQPQQGQRGAATHQSHPHHRTAVLGAKGGGTLVLELEREEEICGLDLLPAEVQGLRLPTHGKLEISRDGRTFTAVVPWRARLPVAYAAGPDIYLGGGQGRISFAFAPAPARFLRFTGALPRGSPLDTPLTDEMGRSRRAAAEWMVAEAIVYATQARPPASLDRELDSLLTYLEESGVRFTACDRWLSARLLERQARGAPAAAFPLFEDRSHLEGNDSAPRFWRFSPAAGTAAVVPRELADTQEEVLRQLLGRGEPWLRSDHGHYSSFVFDTPPPGTDTLVWDGAMLAR
jgi:hypothetical protein